MTTMTGLRRSAHRRPAEYRPGHVDDRHRSPRRRRARRGEPPRRRAARGAAPTLPLTRRRSPVSSSTAGSPGCTSRSASVGSTSHRSTSRSSTTGCSPPARRTRSSATRWATACAARRSSSGARRSRSRSTSAASSPPRTSGASCSRSRAPAPTSPGWRRWPCVDGDVWVLNGQKVWTSLGHRARWGLIICRTDPEAVKHAGITAFVVDMHAPGVEVRPLRQMTGGAEFNEVYFTDVKVPATEMLGRPGDGWRVSLTTLMNERTAIGGATPPRGSGPIASAVELWQALPAEDRSPARARSADAGVDRGRGDPAQQHARRRTTARWACPGRRDRSGSWRRPRTTSGCTRCAWTCSAPTASCPAATTSTTTSGRPRGNDAITRAFLRSRANSIEGGTSEVLRNILGERVLGLPGDVRVDRDVAWNKVPRG